MTHTLTTTRDGRIPTGKSKAGRAVRSGEESVTFWIEGIYERESRGSVTPTSIVVYGDKIYSYGTHFEMARIVRDSKGKPTMILVSADTWGGGSRNPGGNTSSQQGSVRHAVATHAVPLGIPVLNIPFSVLEAAGIDFSCIRILEQRESRRTYHEISSDYMPGEHAYVMGEDGEPKYICAANEGDDRERLSNISTVPYEKAGMAHASPTGYAELRDDGRWHWTVERHWMGDSIIRGKSRETRTRKLDAAERAAYDWYVQVCAWGDELEEEYRSSHVEGEGYHVKLWSWRTDMREYSYELQSQLPAGLSRSRNSEPTVSFSVTRWATYLSSYDYGEPHRPYFFCELPYGSNACTVEDGIAALKPEIVELHERMGDDVKRQGDVFAIATSFTTKQLESMAVGTSVARYDDEGIPRRHTVNIRRRGANESYSAGALDILGTNHQATHVIETKDGRWFGRGTMYHSPEFRGPDHRTVKLDGAEWYEFVKNTVPTGARNSRSSAVQSHSARAWALGGAVD